MQVIGLNIGTRRLNSSFSKQDYENIIFESRRIPTTRRREKTHQDHIADRGHVSMSHCNMVHKPIPISTAMKVLEAKTALKKRWTELQKATSLGRVQSDQ